LQSGDLSPHENVLLEWSALWRTYFPLIPHSFEPSRPLIEAAIPYLSERHRSYEIALDKSNSRLAPLSDPLEMDLGIHRWLCGQREERYTDWLHWVFEQIEEPSALLRVLGIAPIKMQLPTHGARSAKCEVRVEKGYEDHEGRLDLLITFPKDLLIVLEVKVSGGGVVDKHIGYVKSIDGEDSKYSTYPPEGRKFVFLTPDPEDDPNKFLLEERFSKLLWRDLCLNLRRYVAKRVKSGNLTSLAMILSFVGAAEQNLLGLTNRAAVSSGNPLMLNTETIDYLGDFAGGNPMSETGIETKVNGKFFATGHKSYVDAILALREYQRLVFKESRKVLETQLSEFAKTCGQKFKKSEIKPSVSPEKIFKPVYDNWGAWLGASVGSPLILYMGMSIEKEESRCVPTAAVILGLPSKDEYYKSLYSACDEAACKSKDLNCWEIKDDNEIGLSMVFESLDDFHEKLEIVSKQWFEILKGVKR
jgi:hypothetical protein